jgi:hypothetical protein
MGPDALLQLLDREVYIVFIPQLVIYGVREPYEQPDAKGIIDDYFGTFAEHNMF